MGVTKSGVMKRKEISIEGYTANGKKRERKRKDIFLERVKLGKVLLGGEKKVFILRRTEERRGKGFWGMEYAFWGKGLTGRWGAAWGNFLLKDDHVYQQWGGG